MDESQSKSSTSGSVSNSFKKQARDLLDSAEVAKLNNKDCIVIIRGKDPFLVKKLEFKDHPNFQKTGDYDRSRIVDEAYLDIHFPCSEKEDAQGDEIRAEEEHQRDIAVTRRKSARKSQPLRNGRDLAQAAGVSEARLTEAMKKAHSVDKADYAVDAGATVTRTTEAEALKKDNQIQSAAPVEDMFLFSMPEETQAEDDLPPTFSSPTSAGTGNPEDEEAWLFS